jgi:thioester reductase-like protein
MHEPRANEELRTIWPAHALDAARSPLADPIDPFDRMLDDAVLPGDVQPLGPGPLPEPRGLSQAGHVLLTGATGFLGRWLVKEIVDESDAVVTCLVRAGRDPDRLFASLASTGLDAATFERRIRIVEADLREPQLGMTRAAFATLISGVDAICHGGARVNWVLPYRGLAAANVRATRDLLELAALGSVPFHFISSLSVCYSTSAPESASEEFDALPHLRGLHLGYAQTKAVAEALVREAGARGLPVTIYRPSFIAGHSRSGAFNPDDILARVVGGCVQMRTAPDLDWTLDCLPVDVTARQIVDRSTRRGVVHLAHHRPRHWRECVLWMRLYGYDVRLVPYRAWLHQLERETGPSGDPSHPLRPLRPFFLQRPPGAHGLTLPELMLGTGRRALSSGDRPTAADFREVPLDAALLQRYFDAFVASGVVAAPRRGRRAAIQGNGPDLAFLSRTLDATVSHARPLGRLSDHSIVSELTAWRSGRPTGLFHFRVQIDDGPHRGEREVVVKIKPRDRDTIDVGAALARIVDERIGEAYERWADRIGFAASHDRELAIYGQQDVRFRRHAPAVLGALVDPADGTWAIALEAITDGVLMDSVDRPADWTPATVDCAIGGLAALQSIWYGQESALRRQSWIGYVPCTVDIAEMSDLWRAAANHARPRFSAWADPAIGAIQRRLIDNIERWWPWLETPVRTLVHNDFNPRNICLRRGPDGLTLTAYDWELACVGIPQRDLAELLCFVLPPEASHADIDFWTERHRTRLERETSSTIDRDEWEHGFRCALYDLMLNRLPMYALVNRVRRQSFLQRVVRTWRQLYDRYPLDGWLT